MKAERLLIDAKQISNSIHKGGRPYILLADKNELGYSTKAMNWEQFTLASVINSSDATILCNTKGHHVVDNAHLSFIYLLSHNLWITQNIHEPNSNHIVGGMNIYSQHHLKFKDNCIKKVNILNNQSFNSIDARSLIDSIKDGLRFIWHAILKMA